MQADQLTSIVTNLKAAQFKSAKLLAQVIMIMLSIGNVTLYKIATCLPDNGSKLSSKEKALRRLLNKLCNPDAYANFIQKLFRFINKYGADKIINLYADREFPSKVFISFLLKHSVNFIFRIKDNIFATDRRNGRISKCKATYI